MKQRTLALVVALGALVATMSLSRGAGAQEPTPVGTTPTTTVQVPSNDIVVKPNTGTSPASSGDRGGAAQVLLLVVLVGGVALIGVLAIRESRRARSTRSPSEG